jgi:hypothetical protein
MVGLGSRPGDWALTGVRYSIVYTLTSHTLDTPETVATEHGLIVCTKRAYDWILRS